MNLPMDDQPALTLTIVIPAYNEADHVATVIRAAKSSGLGDVLVVDDGSEDQTAHVAEQAGAKVIRLPKNVGKGGALCAAAQETSTDLLMLLDADLKGLETYHLRALADPVLHGMVDMTRGVFTGGRWSTTAAQTMTPLLTGQRVLRRDQLLEMDLSDARYGVEVAITRFAKNHGWETLDVELEDVSQVTKEEKRGFWHGLGVRAKMYGDIIRAAFRRRTQ